MCGRAVDAQVRFINQINKEFNLDLLNRTNIAFVKQDSIVVHNYNNLDDLIKKGTVNKSTFIAIHLVQKTLMKFTFLLENRL
jgi:hypothetical protein